MAKNTKNSLDIIDRKILSTIEADARIPISMLSKRLKISRTSAEYRLAMLEKKSIIRGYYALVDPSKFSLTVWKLWICLHSTGQDDKKKIFSYIDNSPQVWWYAECAGMYDAVICVLAKTPHEFHHFAKNLYDKFGKLISDSVTLINVSFEYHTRGYLLGKSSRLIQSSFQEKPMTREISSDTNKVLSILCNNARASYAELSTKTGKNPKTIKKIIDEMKKSSVIVYFRPSLDVSLVGYESYKVLLHLHSTHGGLLPSIIEWCRNNKNIVACIGCVGPWQLELEVEIETYRDLSLLMTELKDRFPGEIKNYETLLMIREGKFDLNLIDKLEYA